MPKHILVTNDDGMDAPGLWALARAAGELGEVTVIAPDQDQSGQSAAITLRGPIRVQRPPRDPERHFAHLREVVRVHSSPATCVMLAACRLESAPFDLALVGINHGTNAATDIWFSGTVGAARAACLMGVPAVAVSLDHDRRRKEDVLHWEGAARMAAGLGKALLERGGRVLLNLNVPNRPLAKLAGLAATRPSDRTRVVGCEVLAEDPGAYSVRFEPWAEEAAEDGSDLWALQRGLASASVLPPSESGLDLASLCRRVQAELGLGSGEAASLAGHNGRQGERLL